MVIGKRYARALFELASERGIFEETGLDIKKITKIISNYPEWVNILNNPKTSIKRKEQMIKEIGQSIDVDKDVLSLLNILASKNKIDLLEKIEGFYKKMELNKKGQVEAIITLASNNLKENLHSKIESTVKNITGKNPVIKYKIDSSIIGGILIRIGDTVYDGSIKGELDRLKKSLISKESEL